MTHTELTSIATLLGPDWAYVEKGDRSHFTKKGVPVSMEATACALQDALGGGWEISYDGDYTVKHWAGPPDATATESTKARAVFKVAVKEGKCKS